MFPDSSTSVRFSYLRTLGIYVLALTLALPAGVFAEELPAQPEAVESETTAVDDELTVDGQTVPLTDEQIDTVATDTAATASQAAGEAILEDTYRRESLPSEDVFGDFVVGPGRIELEMGPGDTRVVEMTISNRMGEGRFFSFATEDTVGSADGSSAIELLGDEVGPYTLRDFISVPHERFYLEHATRVRIPVTITIPPDVEPGGRYGTLLTSITTPPGQLAVDSGARAGSAVISRVGTLFFIRTPGVVTEDLSLAEFTTRNQQRIFASGPITFNITHDNAGSVHATPYGRVTVTNILGEEVWIRNIDPWFVMPQSMRTREVTWEQEFMVGRYVATVEINRSYDDIIDIKTISFWVIPWKLVGAVFVGLFLFFLLVRFFFSRFEFKRKD